MNNPTIARLNLADETSMVRATETVRLHVLNSTVPLKAANDIISELGGSPIDRAFTARHVAQMIVRDCMVKGSEFDHVKSYKNSLAIAQHLTDKYPGFAKSEDTQEQVVDEVDQMFKAIKPAKVRAVKRMAEAVVHAAAKTVKKTKEVSPTKALKDAGLKPTRRVRGTSSSVSERTEFVNRLVGENPNLKKKELVAMVVEALGIGASNANNMVHRAKDLHGLLKKRG